MPIECEIRDGALVWIKNPITGVISYVVDVRGKSFAFTLGGRESVDPRFERTWGRVTRLGVRGDACHGEVGDMARERVDRPLAVRVHTVAEKEDEEILRRIEPVHAAVSALISSFP